MSGTKLVVALILAMLGVWAVRSFVLDDGDASPTPPVVTTTVDRLADDERRVADEPTSPQPVAAAGDLAGVPVGYPASTEGAAVAAVNWVASFSTIVRMGPIRLDDTLNTLLSDRRAASGSAEVVTDYFRLIDELGPDFASRIWIESPLQVDVVDSTATTASVAVWSMLVTGDVEHGHVEAIWRTHRIDLVWERDDWRIDEVEISEGPTPAPNELGLPSPPSDFVTVDSWKPAVFAATTASEDE